MRMLSLDVVLGALASGSMVVYLLEVRMPVLWWWVLPISVWVIYTADHLMDAYRLKAGAHTDRHLYHNHHFRAIGIVWGLLLLSCLTWIPWQLPASITRLGWAMGGIVLIHLALVSLIGNRVSWFFHKELGVAGVYAAGVWGGPVSVWGQVPGMPERLLFVQFLLLALFNLLLFSLYEIQTDELDGHTSFVRAIGQRSTRVLLAGIGFMILMAGGISTSLSGGDFRIVTVQGLYALMLLVLLASAYFPAYFGQHERYRAWGDVVFIFPGMVGMMSL